MFPGLVQQHYAIRNLSFSAVLVVFPSRPHNVAASAAGSREGGSGTSKKSGIAPGLAASLLQEGDSAPANDFPFISLAKVGHMTMSVMEAGKASICHSSLYSG